MIVRSFEEIAGSDRDVAWGNGQSRRLLLATDGMGFAVADTLVIGLFFGLAVLSVAAGSYSPFLYFRF